MQDVMEEIFTVLEAAMAGASSAIWMKVFRRTSDAKINAHGTHRASMDKESL